MAPSSVCLLGAVVTGVISLGIGLPVTFAAVAALALGYRRRRGVVSEAWGYRHRVLHHVEDTGGFTTAGEAIERVIDGWPRIAAMVGVADPGPVLARSLWTFSEVLVRRSDLRDQRGEFEQIRTDLPTGTELSREVDNRVTQLNTALATFDTEMDATRRPDIGRHTRARGRPAGLSTHVRTSSHD